MHLKWFADHGCCSEQFGLKISPRNTNNTHAQHSTYTHAHHTCTQIHTAVISPPSTNQWSKQPTPLHRPPHPSHPTISALTINRPHQEINTSSPHDLGSRPWQHPQRWLQCCQSRQRGAQWRWELHGPPQTDCNAVLCHSQANKHDTSSPINATHPPPPSPPLSHHHHRASTSRTTPKPQMTANNLDQHTLSLARSLSLSPQSHFKFLFLSL